MKKALKELRKISINADGFYIFLGMIISFIGYLPNVILQKGSVFAYQDQLDGEIFTYIFAAKYWGQNIEVYPEMFNGITLDGLVMPATVFVFLYKTFTPFTALLVMHIIVGIIAFLGMYLLIKKYFGNKLTAFGVGVLFAYLPFYGVYGLSIMGIPFLAFGFLLLFEVGKKKWGYFIIFIFSISSSFVLIGYAVIINLCLFCLILLIKKNFKIFWNSLIGMVEMSLVYILINFSLVKQAIGFTQNDFISHKEELYVYAIPFWQTFKEIFWIGSLHMKSYHNFIVGFTIFTIIVSFFVKKEMSGKMKKSFRMINILFLYNVLVTILCALYASSSIVDWRNQIGGVFKYFQLSRISWITTSVWYFIFAASIIWWIEYIGNSNTKKWGKYIAQVYLLVMILSVSCNVLYHSTFKVNVRQMVNAETSNSITWEKYYNEELFEEIIDYINQPQSEYQIISLGINPAMPLYNGFYCLDGYSNNYDLHFKKKFRKIMEKELDKNEALRMYFDNWGNRCYLLSDELGQDFFYKKDNNKTIYNLEINSKILYQMGGRFVFSAVDIDNCKENNLEFLKYFETEGSTIGIYLYSVLN